MNSIKKIVVGTPTEFASGVIPYKANTERQVRFLDCEGLPIFTVTVSPQGRKLKIASANPMCIEPIVSNSIELSLA